MDNFFHSPVRIVEYVSEYISNFKKQANMQKNKNTNKAKETKEEKRISPKNGLKDIFAATRVKIFLVTCISGVLGVFWPDGKWNIYFSDIPLSFYFYLEKEQSPNDFNTYNSAHKGKQKLWFYWTTKLCVSSDKIC